MRNTNRKEEVKNERSESSRVFEKCGDRSGFSFTSYTSGVSMTNEERKAALEAIIYAADEPAPIDQLARALGEEKLAVQASLDELVASYAAEERGIEVRRVAGGYKLYTKPQQHDVVRWFIKSLRPPLRLTFPTLPTGTATPNTV